jgi:probable addiction module antidote protein
VIPPSACLPLLVRCQGVANIAGEAGLTRDGVYKALRPSSKPQWDTIRSVLAALGLEVRAVPADDKGDKGYAIAA